TAEEARLIIEKRLAAEGGDGLPADPAGYFGPQFFEEFSGLSTRRILELAQARVRGGQSGGGTARHEPAEKGGFISTLAAALGFGAGSGEEADEAPAIDFREAWERFTGQSEAEIPLDDQGLLDVLTGALSLAREEWGRAIDVAVRPLSVAE